MVDANFSKYDRQGAYHWKETCPDAKHYNAFLAARYAVLLRELERVKPIGDGRLLDVGCGDGVLLFRTQSAGWHSFGVDSSFSGLLAAATEFKKLAVKPAIAQGSTYHLPIRVASMDLVIVADVIEHLYNPRLMLDEAYRVLKKQGYLLVSTPIKTRPEVSDTEHVREFTWVELQSLIAERFVSEAIFSHPRRLHAAYMYRIFGRCALRRFMNLLALRGINVFEWQAAEASSMMMTVVAQPK